MDTEARYYKKDAINKCRCVLCPHRCFMPNNKTGLCKVRYNKDGVVYTKIYGELTSYAMDPIEKKPLYHFYPGTEIFSIGTWGCSFRCTNCQNWSISQQQVPTEHFEKEAVVDIAIHEKSIGVAFTYNEPTIWFEYVYDTAKLAREKGLKTVLVTNGFINEEPLKELLTVVDAMNIDLKASNEAFYREVCFGQLPPVMRSIKMAFEAGVHVELTNLLIPTLNDRDDEIQEIVDWVASLSDEIPLHFSRYFPQHKMDIDPTPVETLMRAREIARKKLKYVYLGNVPSNIGGSDTACPKCNKEIIKRVFPSIDASGVEAGKCKHCGEKIYGRFL